MSVLKDKRIAVLVMLLMIISGTLIGSYNTLADMRKEALAVFSVGIHGDGIGIQGDLNERESIAYNMVIVARRYLQEDHTLIVNVLEARNELLAAGSIRAMRAADQKLETAVKDLCDVLNGMSLSQQDSRYPSSLYSDFRSRGDTISHDPYNAGATAFNSILRRFPAGFFASLTGIKPVELF